MSGCWRSLLILLCACKAEIGSGQLDPDGNGGEMSVIDAPVDAPGTFGPWSTPMPVPGANTTAGEDDITLSYSGLEIVFAREEAADANNKHLYWMSRPSVTSMQWSAPVRLGFNANTFVDQTPRFSADDKTLFFGSTRTGTTGGSDIWFTTRPTPGVNAGWSGPVLVPNINSAQGEKWCMPCQGRYLVVSQRPPSVNDDIWEGTTGNAPSLSSLSDAMFGDIGAFLSPDCLTSYFASNRSGTTRIYKATRTSVTAAWSNPQLFPDFMNVGMSQEDPFISNDQKTFVFAVTIAAGNKDIYITTR